jgi:hypothetical protein
MNILVLGGGQQGRVIAGDLARSLRPKGRRDGVGAARGASGVSKQSCVRRV